MNIIGINNVGWVAIGIQIREYYQKKKISIREQELGYNVLTFGYDFNPFPYWW